MAILRPIFDGSRDVEIHAKEIRSFVCKDGGVEIRVKDDRKDPLVIPHAVWEEFCHDAIASLNRRELERRNGG